MKLSVDDDVGAARWNFSGCDLPVWELQESPEEDEAADGDEERYLLVLSLGMSMMMFRILSCEEETGPYSGSLKLELAGTMIDPCV